MLRAALVSTSRAASRHSLAHVNRGVRSVATTADAFRKDVLAKFVPSEGTGYINGQFSAAASGATFDVVDPATLDVVGSVADMNVADTRAAIDAAAVALKGWRGLVARERGQILRKWYELMVANERELGEILMRESGKPLAEARGEIMYGAGFVEWFAEEARRQYGETLPSMHDNRRLMVIKQPIGVAAMITPWNFPNAMITRKVAPALAAGCTAVVKPAEDTPLSALAICELAKQAGIPDGAINVVTTSRDNAAAVGHELCTNKTVRAMSFTGSTAVGKHLYKECASTVKKISLELGGNAPCIVFDDADIDRAVAGAIAAKFRNAGQTCVCVNRIFVQAGIYDEFAKKFTAAVAAMRMGVGSDDSVQLGPVINSAARERIGAMIDDAVSKGGAIQQFTDNVPSTGHFVPPTVLLNATTNMQLFQQELFGPVAPLFKFETEEEVVAMANDVDVGLAGYFFTNDMPRMFRVAEAMEVGMVGVNEGLITAEVAPFGGVKESGLGREGSFTGMEEFQELKYICFGL